MLFIDNKYSKIYFSIVQRGRDRILPPQTYTEKHHIIPRCLGGSCEDHNLVILTAREHFICHRLLTKMTAGKNRNKMYHALRCFVRAGSKNPRHLKITAHVYEAMSEKQAIAAKEDHLGVLYWNNGEVQVKSRVCPGPNFTRGRLSKGKKRWWTNGAVNRLQERPPDASWILGRSRKPNQRKWTNGQAVKVSDGSPGTGWYLGGTKHTDETKRKIAAHRKNQKNVFTKSVRLIDKNGNVHIFASATEACEVLFGSQQNYGKLTHMIRLYENGKRPRIDSSFYGWYGEYI